MRLIILSEDKYQIRVICAWCQKDMGIKLVGAKPTDRPENNGEWVSHTICSDCRAKVESQLSAGG